MAVEKMKEKATTMDENEIHALLTSTCTSTAAVSLVQLSASSLGGCQGEISQWLEMCNGDKDASGLGLQQTASGGCKTFDTLERLVEHAQLQSPRASLGFSKLLLNLEC